MENQNIGVVNAMIRITCGFVLLVFSALKISRRPWKQKYWLALILAATKIAEGIVKYCPVTSMVEKQLGHRLQFTLKKEE
ncbi:YgaP family membrane protein [Halalkalibacillus halophilus]|uniref:YgaP family membrane protein n=1 Tax=Halalkalibacillus halophilus TaxID=392827 RepID=UPI0003FBA44C|nr:DUF2892 domain-containing protein [Halalkalibacillus halophilus]